MNVSDHIKTTRDYLEYILATAQKEDPQVATFLTRHGFGDHILYQEHGLAEWEEEYAALERTQFEFMD